LLGDGYLHIVRNPSFVHCLLELIPPVRVLRLYRLHVGVDDLPGICGRPKINRPGAAGQCRLVLQTDESQVSIGKQHARDTDLVVGFVNGPEIPSAVFQNRFDCRIESVE
jgi:hypothetical protein